VTLARSNGRCAVHRRRQQGVVRLQDHRLAQGFNQIQAGSAEYNWASSPGTWPHLARRLHHQGKFLNRIKEAFDEDADLPSLIVASYFAPPSRNPSTAGDTRGEGHRTRHPDPGFSSALSYYDALRTERLPAALTQGLRDFFGAHTYGASTPTPARSSTRCGAATAAKFLPSGPSG